MERQDNMINAQGLAENLRRSTEAKHLQAERSGYIAEILRKRASQEGYGLFLRNLAPAYDALEQALRAQTENAVLAPFDWQPLLRHQAMIDDLRALAGASWQETLEHLPESDAYAGRIEQVSAEAPHRLLGHAYVRYIGDLSGGQIVKTILLASPGLSADMLTFYDFDDIPDAERFKEQFREKLDLVGKDGPISDEIVDEAITAFQLNIDLSLAVQQVMQRSGR
jgi:heme oxygenase